MYAIIKTGGKQMKVAKGDQLAVEKLVGDAGTKVTLDMVLMVNDGGKLTVGTPLITGATVTGTIEAQKRGEKVIIFKKKRRQNYRRKNGHRQSLTVLNIDSINVK